MINQWVKLLFSSSLISAIIFSSAVQSEDIGELNSEILLRGENTSGLPGGRDDLQRTRLFVWSELNAPINDYFSFGVSFYGNLGTDDQQDNRMNLDNSESNHAELDQYYLDFNFSENGFLRAGKQLIPIKISSMLWDKDITTIGATIKQDWMDEQDNEYSVTVGGYQVDHIFTDQAKMELVDFHLNRSLGALFLSSGFTYMQVTDSQTIIQDNVRRTNTEAALIEGFDIGLIDLSIGFSLMDNPVTFGVEASQNFALDDANKAYRVNLILGDNSVASGWQFNLHYQDIERDAVVAAFNDDDWWFASWMTGYRASASYGITDDTFVQVSYFDEKLQAFNTKRIFLEIRSFFD